MDPAYVKFVQNYAADDLKKAESAVREKRDLVAKDRKVVDVASVKFDRANNTYFQAENDLSKAK